MTYIYVYTKRNVLVNCPCLLCGEGKVYVIMVLWHLYLGERQSYVF